MPSETGQAEQTPLDKLEQMYMNDIQNRINAAHEDLEEMPGPDPNDVLNTAEVIEHTRREIMDEHDHWVATRTKAVQLFTEIRTQKPVAHGQCLSDDEMIIERLTAMCEEAAEGFKNVGKECYCGLGNEGHRKCTACELRAIVEEVRSRYDKPASDLLTCMRVATYYKVKMWDALREAEAFTTLDVETRDIEDYAVQCDNAADAFTLTFENLIAELNDNEEGVREGPVAT